MTAALSSVGLSNAAAWLVAAPGALVGAVAFGWLVWRSAVVRWLFGLIGFGFVIWILYTPHVVFVPSGPDADRLGHDVFFPNHTFLSNGDDECFGGVYDSVPAAAGVGGLLLVLVGAAGLQLFAQRRRELTLAFGAVYAITLLVLWFVSPGIWGARYCY